MIKNACLEWFVPVCLATSLGHCQTGSAHKIESFPAHPTIAGTQNQRLSSSEIRELRPFVAPLLLETGEIKSELVLANAASQNTSATISLISEDGTVRSVHRVVLKPHERATMTLEAADAYNNIKPQWGSLLVEQDPSSSGVAVAGQLLMTDTRGSVPTFIDEELAMPEAEGSNTLQAVTDQADGPPFLSITNTDTSPQFVTIQCFSQGDVRPTKEVEIPARGMTAVKACSEGSRTSLASYSAGIAERPEPGVYGIQIEGDGVQGTLAAFALAPHLKGHDLIFSSVPFHDPMLSHSSEYVFAGVPIGTQTALSSGVYKPWLSLANFSDTPQRFSIYLADSPSFDSHADPVRVTPRLLDTITIVGHHAAEYVFSDQEALSGLAHSVMVKSEGEPGPYEVKLVSRGTGALFEAELLTKQELDMNNAGVHPWTTRDGAESHLLLFNHRAEPKRIGVFINSGTTVWRRETMLAPFQTIDLSINELVRNRVADDSGSVLSAAVTQGVIDWNSPENGDVTGRLLVADPTTAMARNYSCGTYTGVCSLVFQTLSSIISVDQLEQLYSATANMCLYEANPRNGQTCVNGTQTQGTAVLGWAAPTPSLVAFGSSGQQSSPTPMFSGVAAGTGSVKVSASAGSCTSSGGGNPTVQACPTSISVSKTTSQPLSSDFPTYLTGVGILATMAVGPVGTNFNGTQLGEQVTPTGTTCPSSIASAASFPTASGFSPFIIGNNASWEGQAFPSVSDGFYDMHIFKSTSNLLAGTGVSTCQSTAVQHYTCGGNQIGTFTLTATFYAGTIKTIPVTYVTVSKQ